VRGGELFVLDMPCELAENRVSGLNDFELQASVLLCGACRASYCSEVRT
jgi:hypothetical protein